MKFSIPNKRWSLACFLAAVLTLAVGFPSATLASEVSLKIPDLNNAQILQQLHWRPDLLTWASGFAAWVSFLAS